MKTTRVLSWEAHLTQRAGQGDPVAFELLCDLYRPVLMSLAYRMLRNADDANDAVQETMVKAYRAIAGFDAARPLRPWLCRICTNCCVDIARLRRSIGESIDEREFLLEGSTNVDEEVSGSIRSRQLGEAIDRLPERYRSIIVMRHINHMDVIEIAERLQKPEGTIKSWLFRARAMLKKDLQPALG